MCLIIWSWRQRSDYPLVLAANRDEYYERPTAPAGFWAQAPMLLAGRDLAGGGTWLGVTRNGRWAAVTNVRDPSDSQRDRPSRGHLVRDYLVGEARPEIYLREIAARVQDYAGFNLLACNREQMWYFGSFEAAPRLLPPGLYGLSNGRLGDRWPKTEGGTGALSDLLAASVPPQSEDIFALLANTSRPPDHQLPVTGIGLEWERLLSSRFIVSPTYGTRTSTVLLIDAKGVVDFRERTFSPSSPGFTEVRLTFPIVSGFP
jgi:uncharacterized protein with NRDE domain